MAEITYFTCCNMLRLIKLDFYNLLLLKNNNIFLKNIKYAGEKRKEKTKKSKKTHQNSDFDTTNTFKKILMR